MSIDIRFPKITGGTAEDQLRQVQSYLHQLVQQLNYGFTQVEGMMAPYVLPGSDGPGGERETDAATDALTRFNELKALIIKSADIIEAYYDVISTRLEGSFVAVSDFGTFVEQTANDIEANSTAITQFYTNMQQIITDIESLEHSLIDVSANIKTGLLYYDDAGVPIYGLEIGQRTEIDGEEVFNKYARFTAEKLSFYDGNGIEVAYISGQKLYITQVEVTGTFTMGGFVDTVQSDKSIVTRWVGGGS